MTLDDDLVDEHSRHVLVPQIGPEGVARLLATRIVLAGDGPGRALVHDLLDRSGLHLVDAAGDLTIFLGTAPDDDAPCPSMVCWGTDDVLHAATLTGRPCPACVALPLTPLPADRLATQALASLTATVAVLRVVADASPSTDVRLDLASGRIETEVLVGAGCPRCPALGRAAS